MKRRNRKVTPKEQQETWNTFRDQQRKRWNTFQDQRKRWINNKAPTAPPDSTQEELRAIWEALPKEQQVLVEFESDLLTDWGDYYSQEDPRIKTRIGPIKTRKRYNRATRT